MTIDTQLALPELDPVSLRRQRVLSIVIQEYTKGAQPVGSTAIARKYSLGVSAATIRNDMAALEREGLLTHPHTSAGRVPTDAGYRYFVQYLLAESELSITERRDIRTEFGQARQELDQWLRVSTAVLARASRSAALATAPRTAHSRFKHLELVAIRDTRVLLVLVLQQGTVKQQLLDLDEAIAQSELSQVSNELNDKLHGADVAQISAAYSALETQNVQALFTRQVALLVLEIMERIDQRLSGPIYRDGLAQVLEAPEFTSGDHVRKIVSVFEQRPLLQQIVDEYADDNGVQVVISGDGRYAELEDVSLIIGSYGGEHATGILGVIGPLRMSYGRTIGAVRFVARLMSEMVEDMYGY